eukprot:GEZU01006716.1.p1 GENE.GEZU01006716.1~~GEZU01006716.1.p1  ORF type:complete len:164 (+),score=41.11 GEZU01006716.1:661-1152(+)
MNQIIQVSKDSGLDAFVLRQRIAMLFSQKKKAYAICGIQIKLGQFGSRIGMGNIADKYSLRGVVFAATRGANDLIKVLQRHVPNADFHFTSLVLITSKIVETDVKEYVAFDFDPAAGMLYKHGDDKTSKFAKVKLHFVDEAAFVSFDPFMQELHNRWKQMRTV